MTTGKAVLSLFAAVAGLGYVSAAALAVASAVVAFGQDGWAYADVQQQVVLTVFPAWVLTTSVVLARVPRRTPSRATRPTAGSPQQRDHRPSPRLHLVSATADPAFLDHRQPVRSLT